MKVIAWLFGILVSLSWAVMAWADPTLYHTSEQPKAAIAVPLRIWQNPYTMCRLSVYDMQPGEWLDIEGFAQVDAPKSWVGVTTFVNVCDPICKGLDPGDGSAMWGGGNVNHDGLHHQISRPSSWYVAEQYQAEVQLSVVVATYSSRSNKKLRANAEACALKVLRYPSKD